MKRFIAIFLGCVMVVLSQSEDEYVEKTSIFRFAGRSSVIHEFIRQQNNKARFHVIFIVSAPRSFFWGEALIGKLSEDLQKAKFSGSVSAIVRGKRYYADYAYVRANQWKCRVVIDTTGVLLKPINAWEPSLPWMTVWDSTGTLWWWAQVNHAPTGDKLSYFMDSLNATNSPLLPRGYLQTVRKQFHAISVGTPEVSCPIVEMVSRVRLQDDSTTMTGQLFSPVFSSDGRWFAALDFYTQGIRVFDVSKGSQAAHIVANPAASRGRTWFLIDSEYKAIKRYLVGNLCQPQFQDSLLWTIQISAYVRHFSAENIGIDKCYYILAYEPPFQKIVQIAEFQPMTRTYCTGDYCAEGTFHPGSGFVLGKENFYLPFRRGYLAMGSDTLLARNPFENPIADSFYTYAPLYGAFNLATGMFRDSTLGVLDEAIGKKHGLGLAVHGAEHLSCDQTNGLCGWVQWLVPEVQLSDGRTIKLKHYWNAGMLDTNRLSRRTAVPKAREVEYLLDSAGARVQRVILTPSSVFVLWKVKELGFPLDMPERGYWILQQYDLGTATLVAEVQLPRQYLGQGFIDIAYDASRKKIAGLYQSSLETSLVYFSLHDVSHHDK
ncbi:MAG: hypothetical protein N3B17_03965 [Chlorobi bacterium]|nr:hypothetical protein [Chlorobiota bacterium]